MNRPRPALCGAHFFNTPQVNAGSLYCCSRSTFERAACGPCHGGKEPKNDRPKTILAGSRSTFERKLCSVYTKSTLIGEDDGLHAEGSEPAGNAAGHAAGAVASRKALGQANQLLCLCEVAAAPRSAAEAGAAAAGPVPEVRISLVAVDAASASVVFDDFEDAAARGALETRVLQLRPSELLLPAEGALSTATEQLLRRLGQSAHFRVERFAPPLRLLSPCFVLGLPHVIFVALDRSLFFRTKIKACHAFRVETDPLFRTRITS